MSFLREQFFKKIEMFFWMEQFRNCIFLRGQLFKKFFGIYLLREQF